MPAGNHYPDLRSTKWPVHLHNSDSLTQLPVYLLLVSVGSPSLEAFSTGVITCILQLGSTAYGFSNWDTLPSSTYTWIRGESLHLWLSGTATEAIARNQLSFSVAASLLLFLTSSRCFILQLDFTPRFGFLLLHTLCMLLNLVLNPDPIYPQTLILSCYSVSGELFSDTLIIYSVNKLLSGVWSNIMSTCATREHLTIGPGALLTGAAGGGVCYLEKTGTR